MGAVIAVLAWLAFVIFCGYGYVVNILTLVEATGLTGMVIARAIGIFVVPLGIILGYV